MKFGLYSINDSKTGFLQPRMDMNDASAMRSFGVDCKDLKVMNLNPADFDLYKIGVFDSDSGLIEPCIPPVFIASATGFMNEV